MKGYRQGAAWLLGLSCVSLVLLSGGEASASLFSEETGEVAHGVLVAQVVSVDFGSDGHTSRMTLRDAQGGTHLLQDNNPWGGRRDDSLKRFGEVLLRAFDHNRWIELNVNQGSVSAVRLYASADEAGVREVVRRRKESAQPKYRFLD